MKKTLLLFLTAMLFLPALAWGANDNCKRKEEILEKKIATAKSYGNSHKVAGLERALERVQLYCSDTSLRGKAEMKVAEKNEEVLEREADLAEAKQKGDAKKIAKREKKLKEARAELAEAEKERSALKK